MIELGEKIGSLPLFLAENPDIVDQIEPEHGLVVAGTDFDVLITENSWDAKPAFGIVGTELGNLYTHGYIFANIKGKSLHAHWYPSPEVNNALAEELGFKPGRDTFKFVRSQQDIIDSPTYQAHMKAGEYPQSNGPLRFHHNRVFGDHVACALLAPREILLGVQAVANTSASSPTETSTPEYLTEMIDGVSMTASELIVSSIRAIKANAVIEVDKLLHNYRIKQYGLYLAELMGIETEQLPKEDVNKQTILNIYEHIARKIPAIDELAKKAPSTEQIRAQLEADLGTSTA